MFSSSFAIATATAASESIDEWDSTDSGVQGLEGRGVEAGVFAAE